MLAVQNIKINSAIIQKDLSVWIVGMAPVESHRWEGGSCSLVHQEDGGVGPVWSAV